jgi:RNA polymerase sigma factor (sigma-70 family)
MSLPERWGRWEEVAFSDAWLNACAGNYALNYLKSVSGIVAHETQDTMLASRLLLIVDASADPEHEFMCNEDRGALKTAIARLNGRQRIAISLRYFEDCAVSEIARALGVSDDGARKTISRALRTLHSRLTRTAFDADSALRDFAPPRSGRAAIH